MATHTFDIHIAAKPAGDTSGEYAVNAESPSGSAEGTLTLDVNNDDFRRLRAKVEGTAPDLDIRIQFGQVIFKQLFADEILILWSETRGKLTNADKPILHVRLRIDAPELAALPWELLFEKRTKSFLATSANTVLSRYLPAQDAGDLPPQPALRILLAIADPRGPLDLPPIGQAAIDHVEDAIKELGGRADLTTLRSASVARIQQELQRFQPHVLHIIAHGVTSEILLVSDDKGTMIPLKEEAFSQLFSNRKSLRLVLLNVCQSAQGMPGSIFSGIGPALIGRGVPAVIAMQYGTVQLETASLFSRAFYEAVTNNITVEAAVNEARQRISASDLVGDRDWSTPVLYVGTKTGKIIDIAPNAAPTPSQPTAPGQTIGNSATSAGKPLKDDILRELAACMSTLRRARRLELTLLELELKIRELSTEALRPSGTERALAINDKLNQCFGFISRLEEVGDVPVVKPGGAPTKYPTADEFNELLTKIENTPADKTDDVYMDCKRLFRRVQFATNIWRGVLEKELETLTLRVASLA